MNFSVIKLESCKHKSLFVMNSWIMMRILITVQLTWLSLGRGRMIHYF